MRIAVDTNTVVSSLLWQGAPRRLLDAGRNQHATLVTSLDLLAELAEVLGRNKFAQRLRDAGLAVVYAAIVQVVEPAVLPQPVSRDLDDYQVLACALAVKADVVVSGDHDLLTLGSYQRIPMLTASLALDTFNARTRRADESGPHSACLIGGSLIRPLCVLLNLCVEYHVIVIPECVDR